MRLVSLLGGDPAVVVFVLRNEREQRGFLLVRGWIWCMFLLIGGKDSRPFGRVFDREAASTCADSSRASLLDPFRGRSWELGSPTWDSHAKCGSNKGPIDKLLRAVSDSCLCGGADAISRNTEQNNISPEDCFSIVCFCA